MLILATSLLGLISAALAQDCGFTGGFALRYPSSCPSNAPLNCGTGLQPRCCPSGFSCVGGKYCCQNGQDCTQESEDHPQCPDSTWSVWGYNSNGTLGWCCDLGYYGFAYLDNSGVGCQSVGATINTATYHTVLQIATQAVTCSTSSTSTSSSLIASTTTGTSTTSTSSSTSNGSQQTSNAGLTATSASTSSPTSSDAATTGTGVANNSTSSTTSSSGGIGAGAIAGIVIGAVGAIVLILIFGWLLGRRSSKRKAATAASGYPMSGAPGYNQVDSGRQSWQKPKEPVIIQEMPQYEPSAVYEMGHHEPRPVEVPGHHEVPGNTNWQR